MLGIVVYHWQALFIEGFQSSFHSVRIVILSSRALSSFSDSLFHHFFRALKIQDQISWSDLSLKLFCLRDSSRKSIYKIGQAKPCTSTDLVFKQLYHLQWNECEINFKSQPHVFNEMPQRVLKMKTVEVIWAIHLQIFVRMMVDKVAAILCSLHRFSKSVTTSKSGFESVYPLRSAITFKSGLDSMRKFELLSTIPFLSFLILKWVSCCKQLRFCLTIMYLPFSSCRWYHWSIVSCWAKMAKTILDWIQQYFAVNNGPSGIQALPDHQTQVPQISWSPQVVVPTLCPSLPRLWANRQNWCACNCQPPLYS